MQLKRLHKIETFEESADAAKLVSRAIFEGILDDIGETAEIEPTEIMLDEADRTIGVQFILRAPKEAWAGVAEGIHSHAGFTRQLACPGSNLRFLRPLADCYAQDDMIEQRYSLDDMAIAR